ncbi:MAG TPA: hypothetical protein VJY31_09420 [Buttiauxella sp.]|nr:hypothetical protein [Buttiauxella sp.]
MKKIILAATLSLVTTMAFASATMSPNDNSRSNGSSIGQQSSAATGNGDWVGGNGTGAGVYGAGDQTTEPGSRAALVHGSNGTPPGQDK